MCGICGIYSFNGSFVQEASIQMMMKVMLNRGPDDNGIFTDQNIGLGFVRLSILDLSLNGHQPMFAQHGKYVIVYNGELYNYIEIREILKHKYAFHSNTDTEVILYSFMEWGEACLHRFNGMFSFAVLDIENREIFIARDRFGIKPLYYFHNNDVFIFASDIQPILRMMPQKAEANDSTIFDFLLTNRTNHNSNTFFKNISKLQHGHTAKINNHTVDIKPWYILRDHIPDRGLDNAEEYLQLLTDSVRLQMRSDVPVGVCLSGGIDSSTITRIITEKIGIRDIHTFSAVYDIQDKEDESVFISGFKNELKNMHFTYPTSDRLHADLDRFTYAICEPIPGTSEYAEFCVMELMKDYCTVGLNGQGADEVLAGYPYFYGAYYYELLREFRIAKLCRECFFSYLNYPSVLPFYSLLLYASPGFIQKYAFHSRNSIIADEFFSNHKSEKFDDLFSSFYQFNSLKDFIIKHFEYKFEHHLLWADKSSMYFSLETRFPFLDHRLIEKSIATENDLIINRGINKYILRKSTEGLVQDKIRLRRDKNGYETPENSWFRSPKFKTLIADLTNSDSFKHRGYFDQKIVQDVISRHNQSEIDAGGHIWKMVHLELWFKRFIDQPWWQ